MFLSFNATQWVFTTVSLANLLCCFLLGSGPVGCLLCCLSNGETQIWLGDLRLALVLLVCALLVFAIMICQASCDHRRPCRSFLTNSFDSCQDRAFERYRPHRRKKRLGQKKCVRCTAAFQELTSLVKPYDVQIYGNLTPYGSTLWVRVKRHAIHHRDIVLCTEDW